MYKGLHLFCILMLMHIAKCNTALPVEEMYTRSCSSGIIFTWIIEIYFQNLLYLTFLKDFLLCHILKIFIMEKKQFLKA